jgi:histidyl-tRNA synthetase
MQASGAQNTVCAGGRYDSLVEQLGGQATPAVGFAIGLERLLNLLEEKPLEMRQVPHAYLIMSGEQATQQGLALAERLRQALPELILLTDCVGGNFKNQFKRADKSGAALALILGEEEIQSGKVTVKNLREAEEQKTVSIEEVIKMLNPMTKTGSQL